MSQAVSSTKTVWTSFIVDLGDIVLNVLVMIATGSVIMLAEAFEGLSDLVASGLLLVGLRNAMKRPNKLHPFGYGKSLFFYTLLSAMVMLIFGGGLSVYFGVQRLLHPEEIQKAGYAFGALCISVFTNGYALSLSARRLLNGEGWKKLYEKALKSHHLETKNTFILDFTGMASAIIGLVSLSLYQLAGVEYFDAIGAILIGAVIIVSSVLLIMGVKGYLIGKTADAKTIAAIGHATGELEEVPQLHSLKTMYIGSEKLLVQLDIDIRQADAKHLETATQKIKDHIQARVPVVYAIQIEIRTIV